MTKRLTRSPYLKKNKMHDSVRYLKEKQILKKYGLNNKDQYNTSLAMAQHYRAFFRRTPIENPTYETTLERLKRLGVLSKDKKLDLNQITTEAFLKRRLETIVSEKYNLPIKLARQKITQKKVKVNDVLKTHCSFLVRVENEEKITLDERSKRKSKSNTNTV